MGARRWDGGGSGWGLLVGVVELWMWAVWRRVRGCTGVARVWRCGGSDVCRGVSGGPSSGCAELEFWLWGCAYLGAESRKYSLELALLFCGQLWFVGSMLDEFGFWSWFTSCKKLQNWKPNSDKCGRCKRLCFINTELEFV